MAQVPDEAIDRMCEVNDKAFKLYAYYCRRRNRDTGLCFPSLKITAQDTGINYTYCSEMRNQLAAKGWIEITEKGEIRPLLGFVKSSEIPNQSSEIPNQSSEIPNSIFGNSEFFLTPPTPPYKELTPISNPNQLTPTNNPNQLTPVADSFAAAQESARRKKPNSPKNSDFVNLMALHSNRIGTIPDGGKQGKAINWLLKNFTAEEAIEEYNIQLTESWRGKVDWQTVCTNIGHRRDAKRRAALMATKQNTTRNAFAQEFEELRLKGKINA
jgi:hypothetical protein